ncbi:MAG: CoA transferase [Aureispira sp.]|nr:CoA transferase [Aureispira sp.]
MNSILDHITVLDFTRLLPGPLATHMLAQMGANVIKVERTPTSDFLKHQPPFVDERSTLDRALNTLKTVWEINFSTPEGKQQILEKVKDVDVVIEQFRPGIMQKWGLGFEELKAIKPDLIYISLSGYGQTGPMAQEAGHDINYLANAGILDMIRDDNGKPIIPGVQIADIASGSYLTLSACLTALIGRSKDAKAQYIDVSMLNGLVPLLTIPISQEWGGLSANMLKILHGGLVNYNVYEAKDGRWIALGALELKFWNNFCELGDRLDWKRSSQLELSVMTFPKNEVEALFKSKTQAEWVELAQDQDICLSAVLKLEELEAQKQLQHYEMLDSSNGMINLPFRWGNILD